MTTRITSKPQHCDEYYELLVELEEAIENGDADEVADITESLRSWSLCDYEVQHPRSFAQLNSKRARRADGRLG